MIWASSSSFSGGAAGNLSTLAQNLVAYSKAQDKVKATIELEKVYGQSSKSFLLVALSTNVIRSKISADEVAQLKSLINEITDSTPSPIAARAKTIGAASRSILNKSAQERIDHFEILSLKNLIKNKIAAYEKSVGKPPPPVITGLPPSASSIKSSPEEDDDDFVTAHSSFSDDSPDSFVSAAESSYELDEADNTFYERIEALAEIGITNQAVAHSKTTLKDYIADFKKIHQEWVQAGEDPHNEPWLDELLVEFYNSNQFKALVRANPDFAKQPTGMDKLMELNKIYVAAQKGLSDFKHKSLEPNETRQLMALLVLAFNLSPNLLVSVSDASIDQLDDEDQNRAVYTKIHLEGAMEFLVTNTQDQ